jgi:hypothetical protein
MHRLENPSAISESGRPVAIRCTPVESERFRRMGAGQGSLWLRHRVSRRYATRALSRRRSSPALKDRAKLKRRYATSRLEACAPREAG